MSAPAQAMQSATVAEYMQQDDIHVETLQVLVEAADHLCIAGCKYRNLAEPGPERQNGRVYSAGFFGDRWRRYPHPSLSRGLLAGGGVRVVSAVARREGGVPCRPD